MRAGLHTLRLHSVVKSVLSPRIRDTKSPLQMWVPLSQTEMKRKDKKRKERDEREATNEMPDLQMSPWYIEEGCPVLSSGEWLFGLAIFDPFRPAPRTWSPQSEGRCCSRQLIENACLCDGFQFSS